jgi:PadR family transcriptional regulator PadR
MGEARSIGSFEEQVMLGVLRTSGDAYGMAIRRELERVTGREVAIGAVYATLDRLESKGLVSSARTDGGSRRVFQLTRSGLRALGETRDARDRLWSGIDLATPGLAVRRT